MSTKAPLQNAGFADRISFVDVMRGIAVLSMIWMHTADGWLDRAYRGTSLWRGIVSFGGLAAPLFFTLAGVGLGLAWTSSDLDQRKRRFASQVRRGLQLIVLGYALRLQMWMVDAGGYQRLVHWAAAGALLTAFVLAYRALESRTPVRWPLWMAVLSLYSVGLVIVNATAPSRLVGLLRVDVLQGLGASIVLISLACRAWPSLSERPLALGSIGLVIALSTEFARHHVPEIIPVPLSGYFAALPPPPGSSARSLFPLWPWMSYAFVGAAFALLWSRAQDRGNGERALIYTSGVSVVIALAVAETQPWIHALIRDWPQLTQPIRVTYRLAIAGALTYPSLLLARSLLGGLLRQLGTASLWVYWVHLEFAFGSLAHPIRNQFGVIGWLLGLVLLSAAMIVLAFRVNTQVGARRP